MYTPFGEITEHFIKSTLAKKNTSVFELILLCETRANNHKKSYILLSCVIYNITKNYVHISYLAFQSKILSEITVGSGGGSKHGEKSF